MFLYKNIIVIRTRAGYSTFLNKGRIRQTYVRITLRNKADLRKEYITYKIIYT